MIYGKKIRLGVIKLPAFCRGEMLVFYGVILLCYKAF